MTTNKMTDDEKRTQMTARNQAICDYYAAPHSLKETASRFQLGRMRVWQILKDAGVFRPYAKSTRTKFLGVTVSEETKARLTKMAEDNGVSVSRLTAGVLDEVVK